MEKDFNKELKMIIEFNSRMKEKGKLEANAMKRVAAGADLPTPWLFEPAKRPAMPTNALPKEKTRWHRLFP